MDTPQCKSSLKTCVKNILLLIDVFKKTDAEMDLLFGGALRGNTMPAEENNTPDLAGIQQMIRMVGSTFFFVFLLCYEIWDKQIR